MTIQVFKIAVSIFQIAMLLSKEAHSKLCVGVSSGNAGYCVNMNNQTAVNLCTTGDFNLEGDAISECPFTVCK